LQDGFEKQLVSRSSSAYGLMLGLSYRMR
jgi:hypothetical protein